MARPIVLILLLLLAACASPKQEQPEEPCRELWVYAPEHYVLEVAAGEEVVLNPSVWDFPLFCSREEAEDGLHSAKKAGTLPKGTWALFTVEPPKGSPLVKEDLIEYGHPRKLKHPAALRRWEIPRW